MACAFVDAHPAERGRGADMLVQLAMQALRCEITAAGLGIFSSAQL